MVIKNNNTRTARLSNRILRYRRSVDTKYK